MTFLRRSLDTLCAALAAAIGVAVLALPRGDLAGAGLSLLLLLPVTLMLGLSGQWLWRALPTSTRQRLTSSMRWAPRAFIGVATFGVGAWVANLLVADAAFQARTLRAYALVAVLAAAVVWLSGRSRLFHQASDQRLSLPAIAALSGVGLGLLDTHFYPHTYTRLHYPLLAATVALFSVAAGSWLARERHLPGFVRPTVWLAGAALVGALALADKQQTLHAMLHSSTSQQRLLLLARQGLDRDGDGFPALLAGGDCDDRNARAFPLSFAAHDCLGWAERADRTPALSLPASTTRAPDAPRVIVLLTIDAFRCGFDRSESIPELRGACPELTSLGRAGRLRLDAHTTFPRTDEAMGSLNTGAFNYDPADQNNQHLADWLETAGYASHAISTAGNQFPGRVRQSFQTVDLSQRAFGAAGARAEAVTDLTVAAVKRRVVDQPLFVWAHYFDAHAPYVETPGSVWGLGDDVGRYASEVRRVDRAIGRLARELAQLPDAESTVVFVTADHGEEFGEHGARYHGFSLSEAATRIPMLLWSPSAELVARTPTELPLSIAEVGGYLAALVRGAPFASRGEAFFSHKTPVNSSIAIYRNGAKLVYHRAFGFGELYDLKADPEERVNLFHTQPRLRDELGVRLAGYVRPQGVRPSGGPHARTN